MSSEDVVEMAQFVLSNNIFEFNSKKYQQELTVTVGTKFVSLPPLYTYIYVDQVKKKFWKIQRQKLLIWLRYISGIFLRGKLFEGFKQLYLKSVFYSWKMHIKLVDHYH